MITNQLMTRKMGEFNVLQRTSDGYFDGNALLNQWNEVDGNPKREMKKFIGSSKTREFIHELIRDIAQSQKSEMAENQPFKEIKGRNTKNGRTKDQVWMHPYLFIKFAMWINPKFELQVIKFVHDQMIQFRKDAGDAYKEMCAAIAKINKPNKLQESIKEVSRGLNCIVFGKHEKMMRNQVGEESKQRELQEMERKVADLINDGFISTQSELMNYLRKKWQQRYTPKIFIKE